MASRPARALVLFSLLLALAGCDGAVSAAPERISPFIGHWAWQHIQNAHPGNAEMFQYEPCSCWGEIEILADGTLKFWEFCKYANSPCYLHWDDGWGSWFEKGDRVIQMTINYTTYQVMLSADYQWGNWTVIGIDPARTTGTGFYEYGTLAKGIYLNQEDYMPRVCGGAG